MDMSDRLLLEEGISKAFEPFSANLDANSNILVIMESFNLQPDAYINPMKGKRKYVRSSLKGMRPEALINLAESVCQGLSIYPECHNAIEELASNVDEIKSKFELSLPKKLNAVEINSIKTAILSIFIHLEDIKTPDCGNTADVAKKFDLYQGQWGEHPWSLIGEISNQIWETADEDLVDLGQKIINYLSESIDVGEEINKLSKIIRHPLTRHSSLHLIFGTINKPDINIRDVTKRDIEVVNDAGGMVLETTIGDSPLSWRRLLEWFISSSYFTSSLTKSSTEQLFDRLIIATKSSKPEEELFKIYWQKTVGLGDIEAPALLPQVWLQYDMLTARDRSGHSVYTNQRMDFISFLSREDTVILEIDGAQHYSEEQSIDTIQGPKKLRIAQPKLYAEMVEQDREFKMRGYNVLRYGGYEFVGGIAKDKVDKLIRFLKSK